MEKEHKTKKRKRQKRKEQVSFINEKQRYQLGLNVGLNYDYHNTVTSGCARCKL